MKELASGRPECVQPKYDGLSVCKQYQLHLTNQGVYPTQRVQWDYTQSAQAVADAGMSIMMLGNFTGNFGMPVTVLGNLNGNFCKLADVRSQGPLTSNGGILEV